MSVNQSGSDGVQECVEMTIDPIAPIELEAARAELRWHLGELDRRATAIDRGPAGLDLLRSVVGRSVEQQRELLTELLDRVERADGAGLEELGAVVRALYGIVAGTAGAVEWHSPAAAAGHRADVATGPVVGNDDYQRDRSPLVQCFERAWAGSGRASRATGAGDSDAHVDAVAFANGMAALATVIDLVATDRGRPVAPIGLYHETALLLEARFGAALQVVDRSAAEDLVAAVAAGRADTVFVDALTNGPGLELLDWPRLLAGLASAGRRCTVILDTSLLSVRCRPMIAPSSCGVRLVVVESVTKFGQLGLDRVAAGVVLTDRTTAGRLDRLREHRGAGPTQASIRQLPSPCPSILSTRFDRHEANARLLAERLHRDLGGRDGDHRWGRPELAAAYGRPLAVVHPSLPGHRDRAIANRLGCSGPLVVLAGPPLGRLERLVTDIMRAAVATGTGLARGTSFGFDRTRVAVIDQPEERGGPFLRLAVGCEPRDQIDRIADLVTGVIDATDSFHA